MLLYAFLAGIVVGAYLAFRVMRWKQRKFSVFTKKKEGSRPNGANFLEKGARWAGRSITELIFGKPKSDKERNDDKKGGKP